MKKSIDDVNFKGKRVFMRCDFNVPLDNNQNITNDLRIVNALPSIKKILADGARLILASHLGRPNGERKLEFSLKPVAQRLSQLLGQQVKLINDCIGEEVEQAVAKLDNSQALLLENVRFHKEETSKDSNEIKVLANKFARFSDIFVNDAFGTAHRAHASVVGLAKHMEAVSGYLMKKELDYFQKVTNSTSKPIVAIIGGAKVSDKILLIENMIQKVDKIVIGGAMAYTFRYAQGYNVGDSLLEKDKVKVALAIVEKAKKANVQLILPVDNIVCDNFSNDANIKSVTIEQGIDSGWEGVDIGEKTIVLFQQSLRDAKIVVWNGPVGVFEIDKFANGTKKLTQIIGKLQQTTTIIGGGDTAAAVIKFQEDKNMSHISTGGGASLELLEGKILPGVACLTNK